MRVQRYTDLAAFTARVWPYLAASEAEHCLQLGILNDLAARPDSDIAPPYLACVADDDGAIVLVALRTPPHNLILSASATGADLAAAIQTLLPDARAATDSLPGVIGPNEGSRRFADAWGALTSATPRAGLRERIYRVRQVRWPQAVSGAMRPIEEGDRDLLRAWLKAFMLEALGEDAHTVDGMIDGRMRGGSSGMYLWEDDKAVSLAGFGGPTPHGIRIGPVYTPPDARGHGYASALVAQMSLRLLDEGRDFCFLFTDVANRVSNHIYQEIGYEPVGDVSEYRFAGEPPQR